LKKTGERLFRPNLVDAVHAHTHLAAVAAALRNTNGVKVRKEPSFGSVIGVADVVSELSTLATYLARSSHGKHTSSVPYGKR